MTSPRLCPVENGSVRKHRAARPPSLALARAATFVPRIEGGQDLTFGVSSVSCNGRGGWHCLALGIAARRMLQVRASRTMQDLEAPVSATGAVGACRRGVRWPDRKPRRLRAGEEDRRGWRAAAIVWDQSLPGEVAPRLQSAIGPRPTLCGKIVLVRPARPSSGYRSGAHSSSASNSRLPARPASPAATAAVGWRARLQGLKRRAPASHRQALVAALAPPRPSALRSGAAWREPVE
jgi:hypothetical protein